MAPTRRDLVAVPPVARLEHHLRRSHLDDAAGSVRRIGPSIEDVDLVARCGPDLARIRATDEYAAVRIGRDPELEIEIEIGVRRSRQEEPGAGICGYGAFLQLPIGIADL